MYTHELREKWGRNEDNAQAIDTKDKQIQYKVKRVTQFKYPGTIVTQTNDVRVEIQQRIQTGNKFTNACTRSEYKLLSSNGPFVMR